MDKSMGIRQKSIFFCRIQPIILVELNQGNEMSLQVQGFFKKIIKSLRFLN